MPRKIVISASRRTDIPAFHMDWFMKGIRRGCLEVVNPYNRKTKKVPVTPDQVHTIVFWSKDFGRFISEGFGDQLLEMGYHLYFSFTINADNPDLEPRVPPLAERLTQLKTLSHRFDSDWIDWRFDPICFYEDQKGNLKDNLSDFSQIADAASELGLTRCIASFVDLYRKVQNRVRSNPEITFVDPSLEMKSDVVLKLADRLKKRNIQLALCCEKELLEYMPPNTGILQSACIPNHRFKDLFGGNIPLAHDKGQRIKSGCGCRVSVDIGSYNLHPCYHNCLFCYANPSEAPLFQ